MPSSRRRCSADASELLEDPLARLVVDDEVVERVALRRGVLGVRTDVEVEPGAVLQEHVGAAAPRHDPAEQVAGDLVGAEPALAAQGAGHAVLVLEAEDAPLHCGGNLSRPAAALRPDGRPSGDQLCLDRSKRRKQRRPLQRDEHGDLEVVDAASVRSGPASACDRGAAPLRRGRRPRRRHVSSQRGDGLGVAAEHAEALLVDDGAVVEDVEQLVAGRLAPTSATRISTSIGFISWVKIWPRIWAYWLARLRASTSSRRVLVALEVGGAHAGDAELVELVVACRRRRRRCGRRSR